MPRTLLLAVIPLLHFLIYFFNHRSPRPKIKHNAGAHYTYCTFNLPHNSFKILCCPFVYAILYDFFSRSNKVSHSENSYLAHFKCIKISENNTFKRKRVNPNLSG